MARNIGQRNCYFCPSPVVLKEAERPITKEDSGAYYTEYQGMLVANAECPACLAKYLAWVTGPAGSSWNSTPRDEGQTHCDLSFRSTFNDEPGEDDLPRYKVVSKLVRVGVFTDTDSNYFRLGEVQASEPNDHPNRPQKTDRAGVPYCIFEGCTDKALQESAGPKGNRYYKGCTKHYALLGMGVNP